MACLERASPALKELLLKIYRAEKPLEIDHHIYEFGAVEYYIQSSASDSHNTFLSISTPILSEGIMLSNGLSDYTIQMVKETCSDIVEIVEPPKEGYQLTLRLSFTKLPRRKDSIKVITRLCTLQAVILSSQLKEMLRNVGSQDISQGMHKPIKLVYHPREPFFVVKQPEKITAVFPMRFKENTDVIIATAFFQELMDVGSKQEWAKAPSCCWSPIPPPELRGEPIEDLSTNGGFVSFDISSRHVEGKRLDKTVWNLLNFNAYVKYHIKCTRGFIQRRMRKLLNDLVELLCKESAEENEQEKKGQGFRCVQKLVSLSKSKFLKRRCSLTTKIKRRINCPKKIRGFGRFRRRWLKMPNFPSATKYTKLE